MKKGSTLLFSMNLQRSNEHFTAIDFEGNHSLGQSSDKAESRKIISESTAMFVGILSACSLVSS